MKVRWLFGGAVVIAMAFSGGCSDDDDDGGGGAGGTGGTTGGTGGSGGSGGSGGTGGTGGTGGSGGVSTGGTTTGGLGGLAGGGAGGEGGAACEVFGMAGAAGSASMGSIDDLPVGELVINEVVASNGTDGVEFYNRGERCIDLGGFYWKDSDDENIFIIPNGEVIEPGGFLFFDSTHPRFIFGLSNAGDQLRLFAPDGTAMDSTSWGQDEALVSWGRNPDGAGATNDLSNAGMAFKSLEEATLGSENAAVLAPIQ